VTAPPGPRLVRTPSARGERTAPVGRGRGRRLLRLTLAAALVLAAAGGLVEMRRARYLEARLAQQSAALAAADAEIAARRDQLGALRSGLAEVRQRLEALEAAAARDPRVREGAPPPADR
jgi:uncharacterized coiled-coil protein SlyX